MRDTLKSFLDSNHKNIFYRQDLGLETIQVGEEKNDQAIRDEGINYVWQGFRENPNSNYAFRKLVTVLSRYGRSNELFEAAKMFGGYKINRTDPVYQQIMGMSQGQ